MHASFAKWIRQRRSRTEISPCHFWPFGMRVRTTMLSAEVEEGKEKLVLLEKPGPTAEAFHSKALFAAPEEIAQRAGS